MYKVYNLNKHEQYNYTAPVMGLFYRAWNSVVLMSCHTVLILGWTFNLSTRVSYLTIQVQGIDIKLCGNIPCQCYNNSSEFNIFYIGKIQVSTMRLDHLNNFHFLNCRLYQFKTYSNTIWGISCTTMWSTVLSSGIWETHLKSIYTTVL